MCEDRRVSGAATVERRSLAELTRAVFGEELSIDDAWSRVDAVEPLVVEDSIWVGSIGYELHKDHREFAQHLREAGIERLIDVRDLPISRRRGYAKTALSNALANVGVEYVHAKALGNPKLFRDLYKSGRVDEGREQYREHLLGEHLPDLRALVELLREKRSALMCVEHDPATCHRTVIVEALADELDLQLTVAELA
jgi:uncharacterized protein (DUF488 family)